MKRLRNDRGSSLVEFALLTPVFFGVVLAAFTFLWVLASKSAISGAARAGARYASIQHDFLDCQITGPCDTSYPTQQQVDAYVRDRAGVFHVKNVSISPSVNPADSSTEPYRNQVITVTVSADIPTIFGPIASLFGADHVTYSSTAVSRAE